VSTLLVSAFHRGKRFAQVALRLLSLIVLNIVNYIHVAAQGV
jgi:hypothetical protein